MSEPSEQRSDKRYVPRDKYRVDFYYNLETKVEFVSADEKESKVGKHTGLSKNFSVRGMCFMSDVQLHRGDHLSLQVYIPLQDKPICMEGEVCWSDKRQAEGGQAAYNTGVMLNSVEGKSVEETIYHDERYDVDWSEVLESVLGRYRILAQEQNKREQE